MVKIKFSEDFTDQPAVLRVVGVGGGGGNAVNRMIQSDVRHVEFISANTDAQWLRHSSLAPVRLQLGSKLTKGLGAGGDPERGRLAAEESEADLKNVLTAADTKAQQLQKTEEKIPSPSIKPITIRQITIVPKEETSASVSPSVNQILVDSEAVRKLDELIKAHRAGKS